MKAIERLYLYFEKKGLKPTVVEKEINLSNGYFSAQKKRNADMGERIMMKIIDNCRDLNPEWLLTGCGSMFRNIDCINGVQKNGSDIMLDPYKASCFKKFRLANWPTISEAAKYLECSDDDILSIEAGKKCISISVFNKILNNLETLQGEIDFLENYPRLNGRLTGSDEQFYEIVKNAVDILKKNSEQLDRLIALLEQKKNSHILLHSRNA